MGRRTAPWTHGPMDPLRRRRVVALFRAGGDVGFLHADEDAAPGAVALRVARRVANHVLAGELVGNLAVDAAKFPCRAREEDAAAGLLRELAQHVVGFVEGPAQVVGALASQ